MALTPVQTQELDAKTQPATPSTAGVVKAASTMAVGSIQQSVLSTAQFQTEVGTDWVLMDGQSVTGSRYHTITGNANVPDAAGRFLRMAGGSAGTIGAAQDDATAKNGLTNSTSSLSGTSGGQSVSHTHSIPAHGHDFWLNNSGGGGAARAQKVGAGGVEGTLLSQFDAQPSNGYGAGVQSGGSGNTGGYSVDHTHSTSGTAAAQTISGDTETRPINIAVNYFIRIN